MTQIWNNVVAVVGDGDDACSHVWATSVVGVLSGPQMQLGCPVAVEGTLNSGMVAIFGGQKWSLAFVNMNC